MIVPPFDTLWKAAGKRHAAVRVQACPGAPAPSAALSWRAAQRDAEKTSGEAAERVRR
jgi:hypothetical protein